MPDGRFQFTLSAEPGYNYDIQASTNLDAWLTIATLPNPTGTIQFIDPDAPSYSRRLYRAARLANAPPVFMLSNPIRQGNQFAFTVTGPTGQVIRIEAATNMLNWQTIATLTNTTGTLQYTDASPPSAPCFYRAATP